MLSGLIGVKATGTSQLHSPSRHPWESRAVNSSTPQAFFRALHDAFSLRLREASSSAEAIGQLLGVAFDSFDGNVVIQCEDEPPLACTRGCASCCSLRVVATAPEVLLVARFLRAVVPQLEARGIDLLGRLRAADALTRHLDETQRVALRQPCPFIAQGVCVIYAVRPLACRGHASQDARACAQAAARLRDEVPYSPGHQLVRSLVQNALQSALCERGLSWMLHELNHAVLLALMLPEAERDWLAGAAPLQAAQIAGLPQDEMRAGYAQLLRG